MTQVELAAEVGATQSELSRWERGEALPVLPKLFALCRALEISSDLLLGLVAGAP